MGKQHGHGRAKYKKPIRRKMPKTGGGDGGVIDKRRKNIRFIQRGKEMVKLHRNQKIVQDKYREQAKTTEEFDDVDSENEEKNPFDQLIDMLERRPAKTVASSDSSDSSAEEQDEEVDDEEQDEEVDDEEQVEEVDSEEQDEELDDKEESEAELDEEDNDEQHDEVGLEISEGEDEIDPDNNDAIEKANDTFIQHLDCELAPAHVENLLETPVKSYKKCLQWPCIGDVYLDIPLKSKQEPLEESTKALEPKPIALTNADDLKLAGVKTTLAKNAETPLTSRQAEIFTVLNNYQDLFYPHRSMEQAEELRQIYCLHALNHLLKTRARIMQHSAKVAAATKKVKNYLVPDSYRDQGLVRPKILIVLPVRDAAYRVVNTMAQLLHGDQVAACKTNGTIMNYARFESDYTGNELRMPKANPKPDDFEKTFSGNTDDNFRIGISLTKKCLKLYSPFYASDILIASPLGLRMIIGAPGNKERDYDFLNSIELLIVDQAELILAQNWENLLHVFEHLHLQPTSLRNTDFERVRTWCLSGHASFYRQTLLFASHELPEFRAIFNSKCHNYRGSVHVSNPIRCGDIRNVIVPISQVFERVDVSSLETSFEQRFKYFVNEVLPAYRAPSHSHCLIYAPSYFDFVCLRNHFKAETVSFVQICEYTKKPKIARARDMFFHSGAHFLLYSERSHFFRRTRIKGIRHIIMYQPPAWPHFYSELVNLMHDANQNANDGLENSMSIRVLYTKYDILQLNAILGSENASELLKQGKRTHAFAIE